MNERNDYFKPKNEKSRWRYLYDGIKDFDLDAFLSFEDLKKICGFDVRKYRQVIYHTNKILLSNYKKMLVSVKGMGYKIANPDEHMCHASDRKIRATKQLKKGVHEITNINHDRMTTNEKINAEHITNHLLTKLSYMTREVPEIIEMKKGNKHIKGIRISNVNLNAKDELVERLNSIELELARLRKEREEEN